MHWNIKSRWAETLVLPLCFVTCVFLQDSYTLMLNGVLQFQIKITLKKTCENSESQIKFWKNVCTLFWIESKSSAWHVVTFCSCHLSCKANGKAAVTERSYFNECVCVCVCVCVCLQRCRGNIRGESIDSRRLTAVPWAPWRRPDSTRSG